MSIKNRIKDFIGYLGIEVKAFEKSCGLSNGFVNNIGQGIRPSSLDKIIEKYPQLNRNWVLTGEGNMISPRVEAVPLHLADPHGLEATESKFYDLPDGTTVMQIAVVPQKAWGSYLRGHADPEFYDGFETITVPVNQHHRGTYLAFEMKGRSMVNIDNEEMARKSLWPGQKVIGRNLKREQWEYKLHIHDNDAWVIVHKTEGIVVKEIIDHNVDTGILTLHSWNPDKTEYPDYTIHIDDVDQLFNVVDPFGKMRPY